MDHMQEITKRLYRAEALWKNTNPKAGQSISLGGAADLVGEIVHDPIHDGIPGIEDMRANFRKAKVIKSYNPIINSDMAPKTLGKTEVRIPYDKQGEFERNSQGVVNVRPKVIFRPDRLTVGLATHEATHLVEGVGRLITETDPALSHNVMYARNHLRSVHAAVAEGAANELREHYENLGVPFRTRHDD
jgi:hypothetical protein